MAWPPDLTDKEILDGFGTSEESTRRALIRSRELRATLAKATAEAVAQQRRRGFRVVDGGKPADAPAEHACRILEDDDGEDRGPVDPSDAE